MQKQSTLKQRAINSAIQQNWEDAVSLNLEILQDFPRDLDALNRLGLAQMQLKKINEAKKTFKKVLELDKSNIIANKNLTKLKNNNTDSGIAFASNCHFIEEPGKTKIIELHRLAGKQVLDTLRIGQPCMLSLKNRYISIMCDGKYVGALPDDISFRLIRLIHDENEYSCSIHSCNSKKCCVHIKEIKSSKKNAHLQSFPIAKSSMNNYVYADDDMLMEEFIPISTDNDSEMPIIEDSLNDFDRDDE